ncbi:MAG: hypothetical protein HY863_02930 [Chloroflexi bacterium]|nr:hypothetical protein [Chloroflexota bacterium]
MKKTINYVVAILLISQLLLVSCNTPSSPQTVEITRQVEVTRQIEITREVEVTRIVVVTPTLIPLTPTATFSSLEPADARASKYIGGNESPNFPQGESGKISVVAFGKFKYSSIPIVIRNNTSEDVIRVKVLGIAKSVEGTMLASGGDQGFYPNIVRPGEIALGYVYFGSDINLPEDVKYEFEASAKPKNPDTTKFENIRDLEIFEANLVDRRIIGLLKNTYSEMVHGPISVNVFCFDTDGNILSDNSDFTDKDQVLFDETIPFQVDLGNNQCPVYLITASGYIDF